MYEQAEKLNQRLKSMFNNIEIKDLQEMTKEAIIDIIIRFGQVAKFRCRSNTAYKNFLDSCFRDIAEIMEFTETINNGDGTTREFSKLKAVM